MTEQSKCKRPEFDDLPDPEHVPEREVFVIETRMPPEPNSPKEPLWCSGNAFTTRAMAEREIGLRKEKWPGLEIEYRVVKYVPEDTSGLRKDWVTPVKS